MPSWYAGQFDEMGMGRDAREWGYPDFAHRGVTFEEAELKSVLVLDVMVLVECGEALGFVDLIRNFHQRFIHQRRPHARPRPDRCQRGRCTRCTSAAAQAEDGGEALWIVADRSQDVGDGTAGELEHVCAA